MSWDPVYRLVKRIPRGRVTTYGDLAKALRMPGGARVVGWAVAATPKGKGIPWHRVISAGGKIRMPEPHASLQRRLLKSEGVDVNRAPINMKTYGWVPKRSASRAGKAKIRPKAKRLRSKSVR
jgi:methylated-DNA-protein-cysteine methyltransferase related protein